VLIEGKIGQIEYRHYILADGKLIHSSNQMTWTLSTTIVYPIIAVGCGAHLTHPTKNDFRIRANGHTAIDYGVRMSDETVTRKGKPSLARFGSPYLTHRRHFKFPCHVLLRILVLRLG
jgi:hypothetical protein